eukprot:15366110-Ditylum_brightwellii.AAC.1
MQPVLSAALTFIEYESCTMFNECAHKEDEPIKGCPYDLKIYPDDSSGIRDPDTTTIALTATRARQLAVLTENGIFPQTDGTGAKMSGLGRVLLAHMD